MLRVLWVPSGWCQVLQRCRRVLPGCRRVLPGWLRVLQVRMVVVSVLSVVLLSSWVQARQAQRVQLPQAQCCLSQWCQWRCGCCCV